MLFRSFFLLIVLFYGNNCLAQKIEFAPNGKFDNSYIHTLTVISSAARSAPAALLCSRIDSTRIKDTSALYDDLKAYLGKSNDTISFFYLYNGTDTSISFTELNGQMIGAVYAQTANKQFKEYKPINGFVSYTCGVGVKVVNYEVGSGKILIFASRHHKAVGDFKTNAYLRIKSDKGVVIKSKPFPISIDVRSFCLAEEYRGLSANNRINVGL